MAAYICQDIYKLLDNNNQKVILRVNVECLVIVAWRRGLREAPFSYRQHKGDSP